jgi:hypothetical protein
MHMNGLSLRITMAKWLPMAIAIVGVSGLAYLGLQQLNRNQMNDPQVQMAEDAALALSSGSAPADVVPRGVSIDLSKSVSPFIAIYDQSGTPLEADAVLGGAPPKPPVGVFAAALERGENRVTWQPEGSVRVALVVVPVPNSSGYYVAAGRSMRDAEGFIDQMTSLFAAGVLFLLAVTLSLELFGAYRHMRAMAAKPQHP